MPGVLTFLGGFGIIVGSWMIHKGLGVVVLSLYVLLSGLIAVGIKAYRAQIIKGVNKNVPQNSAD